MSEALINTTVIVTFAMSFIHIMIALAKWIKGN